MGNITLLGIDLAKQVFQVHAEDAEGNRIHNKRLTRSKFISYLDKLPKCKIGMEACGTAHYWARKLVAQGHEVKLINPILVKAYVVRNKTDAKDAEAIAEATLSKKVRSVAIKNLAQQHLTTLHRARSQVVKRRVQLVNHLRSLLAEYGLITAKGHCALNKLIQEVFAQTHGKFPDEVMFVFEDLYNEWQELNKRVLAYDKLVRKAATAHKTAENLTSIPGIGPITATAIIAKIDNVDCFNKAKDFAASFGLTPREHSSAQTRRLGRISKQGDRYIRTLLIHGARSALNAIRRNKHLNSAYHQWARQTLERIGFNKTTTALANKHARMIWALIKHQTKIDLNDALQYQ